MHVSFSITRAAILIFTLYLATLSSAHSPNQGGKSLNGMPGPGNGAQGRSNEARDGPTTLVTAVRTATVMPVKASGAAPPRAVSSYLVAYPEDKFNMLVCIPSTDSRMCVFSYHTSDKWFEARKGQFGVVLIFNNNCEQKMGNWYTLGRDVRGGFTFDAGLPQKPVVTVNVDVLDVTVSYGGTEYGYRGGNYLNSGPPSFPPYAIYTEHTGQVTLGKYST